MRGLRDSDLAGLLVLVPILAEGRRPSSSSTTYDSSSNRIAQAYSNSTNTIAPAQALNHDFSYAAPISTKRLSWRAGLGPVSQHLAELNIYRLVSDSAVPIEDEEQHQQAVENDILVYLDDGITSHHCPRVVKLDEDGNEVGMYLPAYTSSSASLKYATSFCLSG